MSATLDDYRPYGLRRDGVTIPTIAIWVVVSLLLHVGLLLGLPPLKKPNGKEPEPPPLTAYLRSAPQVAPPQVKPPPPPPPPVRAPRPASKAPAPTPRPAPPQTPQTKQPTPAPVIALNKPPPTQPSFTVPAPPAEPPPLKQTPQMTSPPPAETDLAAYVAARKRARGEEAPPTDVEAANRGAMSSAALKQQPTITFGEKPPTPSGGLFQIRRRGYDYAEFMFYGWNTNFGRNVPQMIEVRKGNANDIDIAVIRKIIEIIRNYERGDFQWYSKRTGKSLTLSARARDNAGLEDFMMQEFYEELHRYR